MTNGYLSDQANDEEFRLARELDKVALFFEMNLDEDEIRRTQELYGRVAVRFLPLHGAAALIKKYPALTLTTLVGHAGLAYEQGRYWESFWAELDLEHDAEVENALRGALAGLLKKFGLREFPEISGSYIRVMAMHAGIPVHCLDDVIDLIEEHLLHGRDPSGASLLEWLTEPGMGYRLNRLDSPVRNFLQLGGEVAIDILDRIIEFVCFTSVKPDVWNDLDLETSTTGLPTLILDGLIERLQERPFGQSIDKPMRRTRSRKPTLSFSVQDDQIMIGVPYPADSAEKPWKLSLNGNTREIYADRGWGVDADGEHPLTPVTVTAPAREILLRHESTGANYRIPLVDKADPLLLFTADGRLIQRHTPLPRGVVWAVFPHDATIIDAMTGDNLEPLADPRVPSGWRGWKVWGIDLSAKTSIVVKRVGIDAPIRGVRSLGAPRYEPADPVKGLKTTNGLSVYGGRPTIKLPPHLGSHPEVWSVKVRRSGETNWIAQEQWESGSVDTYLDPFDGVPAGLLGLYEIVVSGAVGSDLRHTLFIAEGLHVDHGIEFRCPVVGGLTPSTTNVECAQPLSVDQASINFSTDVRDSYVRIDSGTASFKLVVTPPYFESRIDTMGTPAQWRTTAQILKPSDLEVHAVAAARVPGEVTVKFALTDDAGSVLQEEDSEARADNIFQISTRTFVDTARKNGACQLVARIDDQRDCTHTLTIAQIRQARLCGSVRLSGKDLVFEDLADEENLAVFLWAATAPWKPVARIDILGNRATLPEGLHAAGALLVQVFVDDPWVTIARPSRPDWTAHRIEQQGWVRDDAGGYEALSRFLSGNGAPPMSEDVVSAAVAALVLLPKEPTDAHSERVRGALTRILCRHPRSSLEALGDSIIPSDEMMGLLIRTHLVGMAFSASFTLNEVHSHAWVGCMVEIADLPSLYSRRDKVFAERSETLGYLENQGGTTLIELLSDGKSSLPKPGVLDRAALVIAEWTHEARDEFFLTFELAPGALLDADMRTAATVDAFHRRGEWSSDPVQTDFAADSRRALREIKAVAPQIFDAIQVRNVAIAGVDLAEYPWMALSVQSLTMAAVARLDARGEFECSPMTSDMREGWARMADLFPAMVATDLLIADALVTHTIFGDLIGEIA